MGHYDRARERYEDLDRFYDNHKEELEDLVGKKLRNKENAIIEVLELDWDVSWYFKCIFEGEIHYFDIDYLLELINNDITL